MFEYGVTRGPARLLFGAGVRRSIGKAASDLGQRVLICTDKRFASLPVMAEIVDDLEANSLETFVFDDTEAELPLHGIHRCVEKFRSKDPQVIIGLGGGSCLDLAKLVSLSLTFPGPLSDYYGEFKVPGPVKPLMAVPTTSGTGSEVTPVAVLADPERTMKVGISSPALIPHTAICDPELTVTCPPSLTAVSGADALAHAIEAFAAIKRPVEADLALRRVFVGKNTLSDQYALAAIKLLFEHLKTAYTDGQNLEARSAVMLASTYAGLAFGAAGTAAAHAIQYPVGAHTHTAHGLGVGILLPFTMDFNINAAVSEYAAVARLIGAADPSATEIEAAQTAIAEIRKLFASLGIPTNLRDIGIEEHDVENLSNLSMGAVRLIENNPQKLDPPSIRKILESALHGA